MKILAICPEMGGIQYHRIYKPLMRMQIDEPELQVYLSQGRHLPDVQGYDLVIFSRYIDTPPQNRADKIDFHYALIQRLAELKIPYILDIDDFWRLPKFHPAQKYYREHNVTNAIKDAITYAAGVTTTTENMAALIRPMNHNVCILPNAIEWTDDQWAQKKEPSEKVRFGWVGGITHENDLRMIADAVNWVCTEHNAEFHICGAMPYEPIWDRIMRLFPEAVLHGGLPANQYGKLYRYFDVALAPLEQSKWNSMKSELKMIEAAEYSLPVIASNVSPFKEHSDNRGLYLCDNTTTAWKQALHYYAVADTLIDKDGQHNYNYCHHNFNIADINRKRLEFYQRLCKRGTSDRI